MPDDAVPKTGRLRPDTALSHTGRPPKGARGFVNPAVHRGSTVLYPDMADRRRGFTQRLEQVPTYGVHGSYTHYALEDMVAELEGGTRCHIVSSGLAAVTMPLLAYLHAGDHLLVPDSCYGPTRNFCDTYLPRVKVAATYYDPGIDAAGLDALFQPNTRVLYIESPGSHTFEMQDVPALANVAHRHGAKVLADNTWGIRVFQPFAHGIDVSIQALTKYVGGHSDVMLGGIVTNSAEDHARVYDTVSILGQFASPDDCWLALRGARTIGVRMDRQLESALKVAMWLRERPEVAEVRYPALEGAPGHAIWKRDFNGAASLFGVVLAGDVSEAAVDAMVDSLELFGIGASWGGYESLVIPTNVTRTVSRAPAGRMVRLHIGLEDPADLIADLERGLAALRG
jgi:cystathionine beta-lyase